MPIRIDNELPAKQSLEIENIFVMSNKRADTQDIRPLHIIILNLMPTKIDTETQLLRLLSNTPLQVNVDFLQVSSHTAKHTSKSHMDKFYYTFDQIKDRKYDGMIITGAPVEQMPFEEVDYWDELCRIMDWTKTNVYSTFHICWGAQAGAYYHFGIPKYMLEEKMTGVFEHQILKPSSPLVRGLDDVVYAPHSRNTEVRAEDIAANPDLELIAVSDEAGVFIAKSTDSRHFFIFGHPEYGSDTLAGEYFRDLKKEENAPLPKHYFPNDDPTQKPISNWRASAQLIYTNWLNYYVYQATPYDIDAAWGIGATN